MKIEKVDLPIEITKSKGLNPIEMKKLGKVVLIAGKNGSGKSRLLQLLQERIKIQKEKTVLDKFRTEIETKQQNIKEWESVLSMANNHPNNTTFYTNNIATAKRSIEQFEKDINNSKGVVLSPTMLPDHVISFVPKQTKLQDINHMMRRDFQTLAEDIYKIGVDKVSSSTIPAIEKIINRWLNAQSPGSGLSTEEIQTINQDYNRLLQYINIFLNTDLGRNRDGEPTLFNKRILDAGLSDGQTILLQFCMALFAQESKLEDLIIFMDEPENHLHPKALIELLDRIIPNVKNGQVWIATHSINLLSHFDPSCIHYIEDGKLSYAGNIPEKVLEGLLGDEEQIQKLSNFISLPAEMAINKFAYESLFYPNVVITGADDPQTKQIHSLIAKRIEEGKKLKVLDFGIGKGRLLSSISENERLEGKDVTSWLDYYGYDKFDTNKSKCLGLFEEVYGSSDNRYYNDYTQLHSHYVENTFDFIIMCNVFHEIDPKDWLSEFTSSTSPFRLLKDDGYLLIVEDQLLSIGEKAHSKGFLVFDELEFRRLFKITPEDGYSISDFRGDGQLKAHFIPKPCILRIDSASKKHAIETLYESAQGKVEVLRNDNKPTFKKGRIHAFWCQQLANASLFKREG